MRLTKMFNYFHNHYQALIRGSQRVARNINASLMMFIVIGITLCLPCAGLLLIENAGQISHNIEHEAEISIFLKKKVDKDQIDFINLALKKSSLVKKIHFEAKLVAWDKLQAKLNLQPISSGISENPLPDAFFVSLNTLNSVQIKEMIQNLKTIEGVDNIVIDGSWIKKLRSILYLIKVSIVFLGALLIIVLIVVIGNTVRLQTLTYKDEIEVSKLIGATNNFIQRPFMYTGLIYGLGGGLITVGILKLITITFNKVGDRLENILGTLVTLKGLPLEYNAFIIVGAMFIGWLASYIAARNSIKKLEVNK